jgi:hypothetical protein
MVITSLLTTLGRWPLGMVRVVYAIVVAIGLGCATVPDFFGVIFPVTTYTLLTVAAYATPAAPKATSAATSRTLRIAPPWGLRFTAPPD